MCWSPTADAVAGGVIGALGVVTLVGARRGRDRVLGALPLVLGVHQLVESVVWLDTQGRVSAGAGRAAVTVWGVIAFVVLPTLVPLGVLVSAWPRDAARLTATLAVGAVVSSVLGFDVAAHGVTARAHGHVLDYGLGITAGWFLIGGYLLATLGAPLLSPDRFVRWFGLVAFVGAVGCAIAWQVEFASTWCAYAAVVSVLLLVWVRRRPEPGSGYAG
ncbi:MAG TPA: DUF6629 family protein [Actinospica sp.]|jgi:hypothetical protein|nr:DUF6629 family protein [Actinospica sp.]